MTTCKPQDTVALFAFDQDRFYEHEQPIHPSFISVRVVYIVFFYVQGGPSWKSEVGIEPIKILRQKSADIET
jgi:hypothetical protein